MKLGSHLCGGGASSKKKRAACNITHSSSCRARSATASDGMDGEGGEKGRSPGGMGVGTKAESGGKEKRGSSFPNAKKIAVHVT